MQNQLNSILIEGTTVTVGPMFDNAVDTSIIFFIESIWRQTAHQFEIHATGKLSERMAESLESGQGVRVVGSIR